MSLADADRELVSRLGLSEFIKLAWPEVEPTRAPIWGWHLDAIAEHLQAAQRRDIRNLLITIPPGMTKTLSAAVFFPAWAWTVDPAEKFIYSTYAQSLSDLSARRHRDLVRSPWYQQRWGDTCQIPSETVRQVRFFENSGKGFRFSTSVGGEVTGRHGTCLVFDDLAKAQDAEGRAAVDPKAIYKANDFWTKTMATRIADPARVIRIGIMQRLHHEDTAAVFLAEGDCEHLSLPMEYEPKRQCYIEATGFKDPRTKQGELLCEDRFPREIVERIKRILGKRASAAQLQQLPTPAGGNLFKDVDMRQYWGVPGVWVKLPDRSVLYIQSWDCSFKDADDSDFVVGQVWGRHKADFFLADEWRAQATVLEVAEAIKMMQGRWPAAIKKLIEDKANGPAVEQTLRRLVKGIKLVNPQGGKIVRANAVVALFEAKNIWLPSPQNAPWVADYKEELAKFPFAPNDDRVDATTQALVYLGAAKAASMLSSIRN